MGPILTKASFFFLTIILAYLCKKIGILRKEDGIALSRIVLNFTLPCAILVSFRTFRFEWSYMLIPLISLSANIVMLLLGTFISRNLVREERVFYMLSMPAYNIGNFTLPFVAGMVGAAGVIGTCLYDLGNSVMCLGMNYVLALFFLGEATLSPSSFRKILLVFTKPAFLSYFIMLILSALHIQLPDIVFDFASTVSPANAPMAMAMIGLMLEFSSDSEKLKDAMVVNILRLVLATCIAFFVYRYAPFDYEIRKAVAITAFAPISTSAPAFVAELNGNIALQGFASTISIIIALIAIPVLVIVL